MLLETLSAAAVTGVSSRQLRNGVRAGRRRRMVKLKSRLIKHRLIKLIREWTLMSTFTMKIVICQILYIWDSSYHHLEEGDTDTQLDLFA